MSRSRDFLVEIGTEELPPKALRELELAFRDGIARGSRRRRRWRTARSIVRHAAPARGAGEAPRGAAAGAEHQAPAGRRCSAAFDASGQADARRARVRARRCGVAVECAAAHRRRQRRVPVLHRLKQGAAAAELLPGIVAGALDAAADPEAHALGRGRRRVRAPRALARDAATARTSCRRRPRTSRRAHTTRGHRFHAPEADPLELAGELREGAARTRPRRRGFRGAARAHSQSRSRGSAAKCRRPRADRSERCSMR